MKKLIAISLVFISILSVHAQENDEKYDLIIDASYEVVEDRLSCIESTMPLNFNSKVKAFVDYFTIKDRDYTRSVVEKRDQFFPIFEEALARHGMPDELKYLSIVESGLRSNAISRVGAGGLWQFMPSTGRMYKLKQSWYIDERMNPYQATDAACRYLKQLHKMFNDWELALAAYNTGPGRVRRAIRRSGYKKKFWDIYRYLPRETRSYLPQFVAITYTMNYLNEHNLAEEELDLQAMPEYDTIHVSDYFHMETFASQLNLCVDDMIKLNPQIIRGAIPEGVKNYPLKVPADLKAAIDSSKDALLDTASKVGKKELEYLARNMPGSTYGRVKQVYRVRSGDVLGTIAERYHVRLSDLRKWNNIRGSMIRVGQRLNIWVLPYYNSKTKSNYVVKNLPATTSKTAPAQPVTTLNGNYYMVKYGDSLWSISKKFDDLSIEKLKKLNNLTTSRINPGQKLRISL
ncbi:MAG: LysM peptidoglycan-binding domain-containing protein [Cyclobacteriaceae bacterium]